MQTERDVIESDSVKVPTRAHVQTERKYLLDLLESFKAVATRAHVRTERAEEVMELFLNA